MHNQDKIFSEAVKLGNLLGTYRGSKQIGMIFGTFDIVHIGHIKFINWAKDHCDILIVALGNDLLVKANKGPKRPLFNQDVRAEVISALKDVDFVLKMDNPGFANDTHEAKNNIAQIIDSVKPDILIVGRTDNSFEAKKEYSTTHKTEFLEYANTRPISSTEIIAKLESLEI